MSTRPKPPPYPKPPRPPAEPPRPQPGHFAGNGPLLRSLTCEGAAFPEKLEARLGHDRGRGAAVARRAIKGRGVCA